MTQLNNIEVVEVLEDFYESCVNFWGNQHPRYDPQRSFSEDECMALAMKDVLNINYLPSVPHGQQIFDYHKKMVVEPYWHEHYESVYEGIIKRCEPFFSQNDKRITA